MQGEEAPSIWSKMKADTEKDYIDRRRFGEWWDYSEEEDDNVVERLIKFQRQVAS